MSKRKRLLVIFAAVLFVFALAGIQRYREIYPACVKITSMEWWETATPDEQLEVAHKVLRLPIPVISHHDVFLVLMDYGNKDSVPRLIRALRWQNWLNVQGDTIACEAAHCQEALCYLTGEDFGYSVSDWRKWWKQTGSKLPREHFYSRNPSKRPR